MTTIECSGSPRKMGREYGEGARADIRYEVENIGIYYVKPERLDGFFAEANRVLPVYLPDLYEELQGVAEGAGVDFKILMAMNFVDTFDNKTERCTPLMLRESADGVIVAKNNDAGEFEKCRFVTLIRRPDKGIPVVTVTYAGWLSGLDSMNAEGVANTHGSVGSKFPRNGDRVDIRLAMMQVMKESRTSGEVLEKLGRYPLTGKGFSIAVGDKYKNTFFIDAAVPKLVKRSENEQFSYSTNLYCAPEVEFADQRDPEVRPFCAKRSEYIAALPEPASLEDIKNMLRDHSSCCAPCRHGGEARSVTKWSMINLPEQGKVLIADGHPCENKYETVTI